LRRDLQKVKGPDIYIPPLAGKPKQQQFTIRSGILSSTSSRRYGTVSASRLLNERTLDLQ